MIVKNEGYRAFFKGFSTTIPGAFLPYSTYFFVYEWLNHHTVKLTAKIKDDRFRHINLLIPLITSPLAEIASVISIFLISLKNIISLCSI